MIYEFTTLLPVIFGSSFSGYGLFQMNILNAEVLEDLGDPLRRIFRHPQAFLGILKAISDSEIAFK